MGGDDAMEGVDDECVLISDVEGGGEGEGSAEEEEVSGSEVRACVLISALSVYKCVCAHMCVRQMKISYACVCM